MGNDFKAQSSNIKKDYERYFHENHSLNSTSLKQIKALSTGVQAYLDKHQPYKDKMSLIKTFKVVDKTIYHAKVDENNQCQGFGKMIKANGNVLFGNFENDFLQGEGFCIFKDGATYAGQFRNNQIQGKGIYSNDKFVYEGDFENGKFQGKGKFTMKSQKYQFIGDFQQGLYLRGKLSWQSSNQQGEKISSTYQGQFNKLGQFEGHGKMQNQFGEYAGQFKEGKKHGQGKFYFINGLMYIGSYKNNQRNGFGTIYNDSLKNYAQKHLQKIQLVAYQGNFEDDVPHGHGKIYDLKAKGLIDLPVESIRAQSTRKQPKKKII